MQVTSNVTQAQNVKDVDAVFTQLETLIQYVSRHFNKSPYNWQLFEFNSDVRPNPLEQGIEFFRKFVVPNNGKAEILQKIVEASYTGIKMMDAEFMPGQDIGFGRIELENGNVYRGLISQVDKSPYLLGIVSEKSADGTISEVVKVDLGLEFGIANGWSVTNKNPRALADFIMEQSRKGYLTKKLANNLLEFCVRTVSEQELQQEAHEYCISFLEGCCIRPKEKTPLLEEEYEITFDGIANTEKPFKVVEKSTGFKENMSLEKLTEMATRLNTHYVSTKEKLYDLETVAKRLSAKIFENSEAILLETLGYDSANTKLYIKLPVSTIGDLKLFNRAKFYVYTSEKFEEIEKLEIEYAFFSDSGRAKAYFSNEGQFYEALEKVNRWTGSTLYICAQNVGNNKSMPIMWFYDSALSGELYDRLL